MTDDEKLLAKALGNCTFVPGTGTKRFARDMAFLAGQEDSKELTVKQKKYLIESVIRFRRQIRPEIVSLAYKIN